MMNLPAAVVLAAAISASPPVFGVDHSALWGESGEKWTPEGRLPDFSFAGYRRGESPIPEPKVTHDIRDFGASGDGVTDDTEAFRRAVAEVGSGVILIPAGRYVLTDIIEIKTPGLVLRGEDRDRTILFFPRYLNDVRPNWGATTTGKRTSNYSWSGGFLWVKGSLGHKKLTTVTAPAARGSVRIEVESSAGLSPGDTVALLVTDSPDNTLAYHLYSDEPADVAKLNGRSRLSFPARITAVGDGFVTLDRPLRTDVRLDWQPALHRHAPTVTEVGIENLTCEFPVTPYGGHFSELGFNPIALNGVAHCWVRRIRILNPDSGLFVDGDFNTAEDILIESQRTPDAVRKGQGHHGITLKGNDNLLTRFDIRLQFEHDITLGGFSSGNVISRGRGLDLCFDHHKRAPFENLFTDIDAGAGTHLWRCGGGAELGWNCGARGTFWNIRSARDLAQPPQRFGPWSLNFVALSGLSSGSSEPGARWIEAIPPERIHPQNLHEAQRDRRLQRAAGTATPPVSTAASR